MGGGYTVLYPLDYTNYIFCIEMSSYECVGVYIHIYIYLLEACNLVNVCTYVYTKIATAGKLITNNCSSNEFLVLIFDCVGRRDFDSLHEINKAQIFWRPLVKGKCQWVLSYEWSLIRLIFSMWSSLAGNFNRSECTSDMK